MAHEWYYTKLSLSSAFLSFSGMCFVLLLVSFCRFLFCFVLLLFSCSRWSFIDVPLIFTYPADHVPDWQPRILLSIWLSPDRLM